MSSSSNPDTQTVIDIHPLTDPDNPQDNISPRKQANLTWPDIEVIQNHDGLISVSVSPACTSPPSDDTYVPNWPTPVDTVWDTAETEIGPSFSKGYSGHHESCNSSPGNSSENNDSTQPSSPHVVLTENGNQYLHLSPCNLSVPRSKRYFQQDRVYSKKLSYFAHTPYNSYIGYQGDKYMTPMFQGYTYGYPPSLPYTYMTSNVGFNCYCASCTGCPCLLNLTSYTNVAVMPKVPWRSAAKLNEVEDRKSHGVSNKPDLIRPETPLLQVANPIKKSPGRPPRKNQMVVSLPGGSTLFSIPLVTTKRKRGRPPKSETSQAEQSEIPVAMKRPSIPDATACKNPKSDGTKKKLTTLEATLDATESVSLPVTSSEKLSISSSSVSLITNMMDYIMDSEKCKESITTIDLTDANSIDMSPEGEIDVQIEVPANHSNAPQVTMEIVANSNYRNDAESDDKMHHNAPSLESDRLDSAGQDTDVRNSWELIDEDLFDDFPELVGTEFSESSNDIEQEQTVAAAPIEERHITHNKSTFSSKTIEPISLDMPNLFDIETCNQGKAEDGRIEAENVDGDSKSDTVSDPGQQQTLPEEYIGEEIHTTKTNRASGSPSGHDSFSESKPYSPSFLSDISDSEEEDEQSTTAHAKSHQGSLHNTENHVPVISKNVDDSTSESDSSMLASIFSPSSIIPCVSPRSEKPNYKEKELCNSSPAGSEKAILGKDETANSYAVSSLNVDSRIDYSEQQKMTQQPGVSENNYYENNKSDMADNLEIIADGENSNQPSHVPQKPVPVSFSIKLPSSSQFAQRRISTANLNLLASASATRPKLDIFDCGLKKGSALNMDKESDRFTRGYTTSISKSNVYTVKSCMESMSSTARDELGHKNASQLPIRQKTFPSISPPLAQVSNENKLRPSWETPNINIFKSRSKTCKKNPLLSQQKEAGTTNEKDSNDSVNDKGSHCDSGYVVVQRKAHRHYAPTEILAPKREKMASIKQPHKNRTKLNPMIRKLMKFTNHQRSWRGQIGRLNPTKNKLNEDLSKLFILGTNPPIGKKQVGGKLKEILLDIPGPMERRPKIRGNKRVETPDATPSNSMPKRQSLFQKDASITREVDCQKTIEEESSLCKTKQDHLTSSQTFYESSSISDLDDDQVGGKTLISKEAAEAGEILLRFYRSQNSDSSSSSQSDQESVASVDNNDDILNVHANNDSLKMV